MGNSPQDNSIKIDGKKIGPGNPTYIIAEMSANHGGDFERAAEIIHAAQVAGADAVKLQTYTADTLTLDCREAPFYIEDGPWAGQTIHQLYQAAYTPWDWQSRLKEIADQAGITLFSAPFDETSVDFLEELNFPAYKIASYEIIEHALLEKVAATGKPLILSTGSATLAEIDEAVRVVQQAGAGEIALLKCTSSYPAPPEDMHLRTIPNLYECFSLPVGLSDHTLGLGAAIAAVTLGACIIEKHFTLDRSIKTPDNFFSMNPSEFEMMVHEIRVAEQALGKVHYPPQAKISRRGLFAVRDIRADESFSKENIRSLRPGGGLPPSFLSCLTGKRAQRDIKYGEPITWNLVG